MLVGAAVGSLAALVRPVLCLRPWAFSVLGGLLVCICVVLHGFLSIPPSLHVWLDRRSFTSMLLFVAEFNLAAGIAAVATSAWAAAALVRAVPQPPVGEGAVRRRGAPAGRAG